MLSNGYAYNVNNELLLGEKDIVHQESSLRNALSDGPSDECAVEVLHVGKCYECHDSGLNQGKQGTV